MLSKLVERKKFGEEYEGGRDPLYEADFKKLCPEKRWTKNALVNQKLILRLDQQRGPKGDEDLHVGATHAIAVDIDKLVEDLKIPVEYWMTLRLGSREHRKEGLTGESWKVPVGDFTGRAAYAQTLLQKLSNFLNSREFITDDVGFSASVLFTRPETKGSKRAGGGPGQKIWDQMAKESRCVCEIKNKDTLCCARAIVVIREYSKRQAGEENTFENIRQDRGKNSPKLKQANKLHQEAVVSEGPCGLEEIEQFQDYLGPQGYRIIVVDAARGGVIFKGNAFHEEKKIIAFVKSQYEDENGELKGHFHGLYSIPAFMIDAVRDIILRTVLTITSRHRIVQLANKVHLRVRIHVHISPFGRNQTEVVKFAEEKFMVRHVLQIISFNRRLRTKS